MPCCATGSSLTAKRALIQHYFHPGDHRCVTVSFHHPGQTYAPKILKAMIELQAGWDEADLRRLKLLK